MSTLTGGENKLLPELHTDHENNDKGLKGLPFSIMVAPGALAVIWLVAFVLFILRTS